MEDCLRPPVRINGDSFYLKVCRRRSGSTVLVVNVFKLRRLLRRLKNLHGAFREIYSWTFWRVSYIYFHGSTTSDSLGFHSLRIYECISSYLKFLVLLCLISFTFISLRRGKDSTRYLKKKIFHGFTKYF